ncbi:MAG TPA: cob(I)yrinic acid a,c-diamide adenosyltransferase [Planctomycetota bacterium]|nr:cob(I)yrinic acid a,c-diamide adenosyltransferase [Planctomycetota bacterium]
MVRLTRIYTRTGDDGTTGLGDGSRVPKTSARIEAYGTVDECNSVLGVCLDLIPAGATRQAQRDRLLRLQQDLFDVGADLCVPHEPPPQGFVPLRIGQHRIERLERWIDEVNAALAPLKTFVLPGGNPLAAQLHVARTVCRRAERRVQSLAERDACNPLCLVYLNRLSDLFFVLARAAAGADELLWVPTHDDEAEA